MEQVVEQMYGYKVDIISIDDTFKFHCDKCGKCCTADTIQTIMFTAYDIFKIAKATKQTARMVFENYAECYIGDVSGMPVVRMLPNKHGKCFFLRDNAC